MVLLAHLVNLSVRQSTFPNAWKTAVVTHIYKVSEATDVANSKLISIVPGASNIIEKVVPAQYTQCSLALENIS